VPIDKTIDDLFSVFDNEAAAYSPAEYFGPALVRLKALS
jgi:hypothetical protein